ncbi:hypothetical protein BDA96_10G331800 [Sorghum bicolor]|uniref:HTH myb-type domain-containing protein n=1 Tax=Sorghum bicolor TaxID=4558 RepID=A0A921Q882_SORBI|nr:uncharacterized protein LOC110431236 isoform X2 [Sorghum bicolor]XP_021305745.1 uncharacterized protein LOC110431236 isoform X2 [Sorghum bicolor]XP_021305747.1 uncharacterized protein LOC110431236 isoform X2 [Sorghum bicolor]XP_021305748.1 uncharacterized protein LOC110431236 isoform X2 [Sorghum bicolor]XP_021305749.1 uncharacterized protein LOC110431236 isoform X2 [Sorghum bicolor]XP_021305750.1 uncharacterized protein LOC110431236 isoform X2 [Sorghum bicolor]XP_021305751.1 uncharacterize|eukprot:XP_021305744.1 uncharacterized protein LOC110431236 isoform X2 [Sorghum bicolor]
MLMTNQAGENNCTEFARDNDHMENINLLEVFPFQTAEAALDFIEGGAAKEAELDLVLVDVNLNNMAPGTSANSDLLHHYVLNELEVPLTAMCSCDDQEALSKCMNLGACFHVLKPLDRRSFGVLWHQALEHKSKKAAVQGPTLNSTRNGMVSSSSTAKPKEVLILERNDLSDPEINGHEEPKKRNRITWTIELHEKFLEAVETLGGNEYATPEGILLLMNIKGLTAKHIGSHLQKHRLRHRNAKQGGQCQENASSKPMGLDEATSQSITPRVETDGEVYPLRLWTEVKKRSADTAAVKTEDTESLCVWDKYENNLRRVFSEKKKRWQFMGKHRWPVNNNIVITDARDPDGAPETAGGYGAFTEISGSSNMITSNQVGENNRTEFARDNDHMENINLLKVYGAFIENAGSSSLLTSDQVEQNNLTEDARNNDAMGKNNFFKGTVDPKYNASMDFSVAWAHLESNDLDLTGPSDGREEAYSFRMSQLESLGLEVLHDNACNDALRSVDLINIDEPVTQGSQEQQSLGMEDLQQVDDIPWDDALISVGLINLLDEPMTEEAAVGGSQDQESLALEVLQAGNNAWDDDLRSARMVNLLDEPVAQEATIGDALMDDPVSPIAQDDVLWAWSPSMPAVDYGMLF